MEKDKVDEEFFCQLNEQEQEYKEESTLGFLTSRKRTGYSKVFLLSSISSSNYNKGNLLPINKWMNDEQMKSLLASILTNHQKI